MTHTGVSVHLRRRQVAPHMPSGRASDPWLTVTGATPGLSAQRRTTSGLDFKTHILLFSGGLSPRSRLPGRRLRSPSLQPATEPSPW